MFGYLNRCFINRFRRTSPADSKTSKATQSTSTGSKTVAAPENPRVPPEITDRILDHLAADPDSKPSLRSCSLVAKSWVASCRYYLFYTILFDWGDIQRWLRTFPVPEQAPTHLVRHICLSNGIRLDFYYHEFLRHIQGFTNLEAISMHGTGQIWWVPWLVGLPQSVTTLAISSDGISILQVQRIMAQLPNLNNLSLSGDIRMPDRKELQGIGTALRGRFGGCLTLGMLGEVVTMLLEIPTGLHFTRLNICPWYDCLPPAVRLTEACSKTLVELYYSVTDPSKSFLIFVWSVLNSKR